MKKNLICFLVLLISTMLMGCGDNAGNEKTKYRDIVIERTDFPDFKEAIYKRTGKNTYISHLGTQFLGEEPIQLWAERYAAQDGTSKIYQWGLDGEEKLLLEGIPDDLTLYGGNCWYLDLEGCFYYLDGPNLIKMDPQGRELFRTENDTSAPWSIKKMCQTPDKKIYLTIDDFKTGNRLAELNADTGDITILEQVETRTDDMFRNSFRLGMGFSGPAILQAGIREVDTEQGEMTDVLNFFGTSYDVSGGGFNAGKELVADFRMVGEECVEILRSTSSGSPAYVEHLSMKEVEKIPVVLCTTTVEGWIRQQISRFNQENETYHIVTEEWIAGDGLTTAEYEESLKDYVTKLSIEIAAGKGPDILIGEEILGGSVMDLIEKGVLEDLRPYMERSGIREEDYFPIAFSAWRRGAEIYGICPNPRIYALEADRDILQGRSDIRGITEALLAYQGEALYVEGMDPTALLRLFLEGSETLWGMIDWEEGTLDFTGELFLDLLQVAQRYGDTRSNVDSSENYIPCIAQRDDFKDYYHVPSASELENEGSVLAGWLFDDGCHAQARGDSIAISSGSAKKEGAWEFLCFLLGEEVQEDYSWAVPVKKSVFTRYADKLLEQIEGDNLATPVLRDRATGEWDIARIYEEKDMDFIKTEKIPYYEKLIEEARYLPLRSAPVLDIICEEAEDYFKGNKSAEEVIKVIENRVRLYVNERGKSLK